MEDRTTTIVTEQAAFFGVYDGHGGDSAAEFCQEYLHKNLMQQMRKHWRPTSQLQTTDTESIQIVSHCLREAFVNTDNQFLRTTQHPRSGTTAVVAIIIDSMVVVGNVGDSRAVLCRGGRAIPLSSDHNCQRSDEVQRVQATGGQVIASEVVVNGEEFCLTRSRYYCFIAWHTHSDVVLQSNWGQFCESSCWI